MHSQPVLSLLGHSSSGVLNRILQDQHRREGCFLVGVYLNREAPVLAPGSARLDWSMSRFPNRLDGRNAWVPISPILMHRLTSARLPSKNTHQFTCSLASGGFLAEHAQGDHGPDGPTRVLITGINLRVTEAGGRAGRRRRRTFGSRVFTCTFFPELLGYQRHSKTLGI